MKKGLLFLMFLAIAVSYSQVPNYYSDVNINLTGVSLKNELASKVTNTHTTFLSYTPGVWDALKQTDLDPLGSGKVILLYGYNDTDGNTTTDRTRGINNNGGGTTDWNREHVYPKSLGNPNLGTSGPGADAHHLRPSDVQRNSNRGSRKFGDGSGNSGTTSQGHWYPGDEFKGDVARMMFYMYIRYGNRCLPTNVAVGSTTANDSNMVQLLLQWNVEDPVSVLELQRNLLLEGIQGNRNPFIDNPAFATSIWGGPQAEDRFGTGSAEDMQAPTAPKNLSSTSTTQTSTQLIWDAATDNVGVTGYEIYRNGSLYTTVSNTTAIISGLSMGTTYTFTIKARDAAGNRSANSNSRSVTTQNGNPGEIHNAVFISEYVEGSSYNKAIEIVNRTGSTINLSAYRLKKQSNGAGPWSSGISLSGILANGAVYVIANNQASSAIINVSDQRSNATEMNFNGNDAIGLFKDANLLDIVGVFNGGTANFGKDKTLRRRTSVTTGSASYTSSEWDSFAQNTFVDLGKHGDGVPGSSTVGVRLRITFDQYPEETSWELRNSDNQIVYSGGPYPNQADNTTLTLTRTLTNGCYTFSIKDAYGDGMCCTYGNGSYQLVRTTTNSVLASGGRYAAQESTSFCTTSTARSSYGLKDSIKKINTVDEVGLIVYPNPAKDYIVLKKSFGDTSEFKIMNHSGQIVRSGTVSKKKISLKQLPTGIYFVSVTTNSNSVFKRFIKQ
ncbi:endonuclease [Aquimarina sp. W85]|uniref:endonuclease n=1 Tax=Aquimarina rhodophyticola TaxID=3342246 RepID=UPI00367277E1